VSKEKMDQERIRYALLNGTVASAAGVILMSLPMSTLHSHYHYLPGVIGSNFPYSFAVFFSIITYVLFFAAEPKVKKAKSAMRKVTNSWYAYTGIVISFGVISNILLNLNFEIVSPEPKYIAEIRFQGAIALFLAIGCVCSWPLFLINLITSKKNT
jgi:uncharacterized membrane protein